MEEIRKELLNLKTIALYGAIGTGKTSLAYNMIETIKPYKKEVYFLNHPKPALIKKLGYKNIDSLERMEDLQDCILYLDEPQITLPIYSKKANTIIAQICSLSRQLGITLIISTSDTRVFTKANEAFFDCWIVKDLDYDMVKRGSKIRKIMQKNSTFNPAGLRLKINEFLFEARNSPDLNGMHTFEELSYFDEALSKPYRTMQTANETAKVGQTANQKNNEITATVQTIQTNKLENEIEVE